YRGVVIARGGEGARETSPVRRIAQGEGVERVSPPNPPKIEKIEVKRGGQPRRAKLYYLRDRVGKATRLREREGKAAVTPSLNGSPNGSAAAKAKAEVPAEGEQKSINRRACREPRRRRFSIYLPFWPQS